MNFMRLKKSSSSAWARFSFEKLGSVPPLASLLSKIKQATNQSELAHRGAWSFLNKIDGSDILAKTCLIRNMFQSAQSAEIFFQKWVPLRMSKAMINKTTKHIQFTTPS